MYKIAQQCEKYLEPGLAVEVIDKLLRIHENDEAGYNSMRDSDLEEHNLAGLMIWAWTPEGQDYWMEINDLLEKAIEKDVA